MLLRTSSSVLLDTCNDIARLKFSAFDPAPLQAWEHYAFTIQQCGMRCAHADRPTTRGITSTAPKQYLSRPLPLCLTEDEDRGRYAQHERGGDGA